MIHLTVTCQLIQTTELFGRDSSAPCRALEGGWEQLITHTGWGWLLGYCILGPGSKNRSAVALGKGRAAGRNVMKTCGHHWFSTFWTCMQTTPCFTLAQQHAWTQHWLINTLSAISHWDAPVSLEFDLNFLWQAHLICFLRFFVFFFVPTITPQSSKVLNINSQVLSAPALNCLFCVRPHFPNQHAD